MHVLALDLGGTKLAIGMLSETGNLLWQKRVALESRKGEAVGRLILEELAAVTQQAVSSFPEAIGISVPGIADQKGTIWAPNLKWETYPLAQQINEVLPSIPCHIDSDRTCYILGEHWKGAAAGCTDAIYLAIGTGIGAGVLTGGMVMRGSNDIAGAVGWLTIGSSSLDNGHRGSLESVASGEGIATLAKRTILEKRHYRGLLYEKANQKLTAEDVFQAYDLGDSVAHDTLNKCIELWGITIANLVSIFNPQKVILGGGVFGPAVQFIPAIVSEARKWAQPISMTQVSVEPSSLGELAGLYGAGYLGIQKAKAEIG